MYPNVSKNGYNVSKNGYNANFMLTKKLYFLYPKCIQLTLKSYILSTTQ
jgi:hypothetical protein